MKRGYIREYLDEYQRDSPIFSSTTIIISILAPVERERATMLNRSPTVNSSGGDPRKTRVGVIDLDTGAGFLYSTDQTAKGRPEWIFPNMSPQVNVMAACGSMITDYDKRNDNPSDLELVSFYPFQNGRRQTMAARVIGPDHNLMQAFEDLYFHRSCPHGIIVMLPLSEWGLQLYNVMNDEQKTRMMEAGIAAQVAREEENVRKFHAMMQQRRHRSKMSQHRRHAKMQQRRCRAF